MPVLRSTYQELHDRYRRAVDARDDAVTLAAERLSTITSLAAEVSQLRDQKPNKPVPAPPPPQGDAELRRRLALAEQTIREQAARLDNLQPDRIVAAQPMKGDAELCRRLDLAHRALVEMQARLDGLQTSHIADTRELHDLRQGVAS